jgi:DMSO/TMAO reductase YedYZ molybdopterin-dependent catalytic subunit
MMNRTLAIFFLLASFCSIIAFGQTKQIPAPVAQVLTVGGEVARPLKLSAADLAKLPRQTVSAKDHDGKTATFEGVALVEVLRLAGVEFGEKLRGKSLALFLVVDAADGYRAVFALPELDPAFTDEVIILADRREGKALSEAEGQWRIVVPNEKRQARWVRQVVSLTIRRA